MLVFRNTSLTMRIRFIPEMTCSTIMRTPEIILLKNLSSKDTVFASGLLCRLITGSAAIMVLMVAMMVFDFIPVAPVTAVMIAGLLMVLTGCFRNVEAAYKTINWETIVLFAAMLPMSLALEKTGASEYISNSLVYFIAATTADSPIQSARWAFLCSNFR